MLRVQLKYENNDNAVREHRANCFRREACKIIKVHRVSESKTIYRKSNLNSVVAPAFSNHGKFGSGTDPGCRPWLSTLDGSPTLPGLRPNQIALITAPVDAFSAITLASTASFTETSRDFANSSKSPIQYPYDPWERKGRNILHRRGLLKK